MELQDFNWSVRREIMCHNCSPKSVPLPLNLFSQLCVVMIFLVTVIIYRSIVSVMMFETGSSVLRTQVGTPSICIKLKYEMTYRNAAFH